MQTIEDGMIKECLICHLKKVMSRCGRELVHAGCTETTTYDHRREWSSYSLCIRHTPQHTKLFKTCNTIDLIAAYYNQFQSDK
jgi:hypothetical protein